MPGQPSAEERAASTPLGELLSEVSRDLSTLFRQEVALAKAELTDSAKKAGKGAGMFGGAGVAAILATRGRKEIKQIDGAPQTVATVKEVPETLKPNTGRN